MTSKTKTETEHWVQIAMEAAEEKLGQNTNAYMVGDILGITDWFIITSGNNARQVRAISDSVAEALSGADCPKALRVEGRDSMTWVLMDYGAFVVHIFDAENREYYDLDRLWRDVPKLDR